MRSCSVSLCGAVVLTTGKEAELAEAGNIAQMLALRESQPEGRNLLGFNIVWFAFKGREHDREGRPSSLRFGAGAKTVSEPPCFSTNCLVTHSPSPVPILPLVVKNGSKIFGSTDFDIPLPLSAMLIRTPRCPLQRHCEVRTFIVPPSATASRLFAIKLEKTCLNSPLTAQVRRSGPKSVFKSIRLESIFFAKRSSDSCITSVRKHLLLSRNPDKIRVPGG